MQASQNTAQVFLGINLKCTSCHDSFVNQWKLKDAYGLAAYFSPDRDAAVVPLRRGAEPVRRAGVPVSAAESCAATASLADRRATAAAIFTDPRNGRLPRTIVNRIWQRLLGHGIVANPDEMDGRPVEPRTARLAGRAISSTHGYDVKHLIATIVTSRAYQLPAVPRASRAAGRGYVFSGPEVRRLTAEQFADAIGAITGEWSVLAGGRSVRRRRQRAPSGASPRRTPIRRRSAPTVATTNGERLAADARARPADPRSGHVGARRRHRRRRRRSSWSTARS